MLERLERFVAAERDYTELRLHRNSSRRLVMRRGSLIENSSTTLAGCAARCHALGTFGFSSVPAEDDHAIERVLSEARANADLVVAPATPIGRCPRQRRGRVFTITARRSRE